VAPGYVAEVIGGHVNPGCRKLIAEPPDEVFIHEAAHDRYMIDMDTPEDYAGILARLAQMPATVADTRAKMEPML
jgi:molybdenum cofactor cytidylyltransferase